MTYRFPKIERIEDVLWAIEGNDAFRVVIKGSYTVVNYSVIGNAFAALPANPSDQDLRRFALVRECRGLKFSPRGDIIARPFHKFFNLGEKFESMWENLPFHLPVRVEEKLDGSMIHPAYLGDDLVFMTKMGVTDVADMAMSHAKSRSVQGDVLGLCQYAMDNGYTPIFEYTGPFNRIVIGYPHEKLTLLACRHMVDGSYMLLEELTDLTAQFGVPLVDFKLVMDFDSYQKHGKDEEGVVILWDSGHRVKLKTEWYSELHRAKEALLSDKKVLALCFSENYDDVSTTLPPQDKQALDSYQQDAVQRARGLIVRSEELFAPLAGIVTPKDFALEHKDKFPSFFQSECFKAIRENRRPDFEAAFKEAVDKPSQYDTLMNVLGMVPWTQFHRVSYAGTMEEAA